MSYVRKTESDCETWLSCQKKHGFEITYTQLQVGTTIFQNFFFLIFLFSRHRPEKPRIIVIGSIVQGTNASCGLIKSTFVLTLLVLKLTYPH